MSYLEAGFNDFLDRSIGSSGAPINLATLSGSNRSLNFDQLQSSGSMGNTLQLGGNIQGGTMGSLRLTGDLTLDGRLIIGKKAFIFDGRSSRQTISDGADTRIEIGQFS